MMPVEDYHETSLGYGSLLILEEFLTNLLLPPKKLLWNWFDSGHQKHLEDQNVFLSLYENWEWNCLFQSLNGDHKQT